MSDLALSPATPVARATGNPSQSAAASSERASPIVWISVFAAMIGAVMAILNIQITNASLLNIEGGIGTCVDNGSWISTSYLIGVIVLTPLTEYPNREFSLPHIA